MRGVNLVPERTKLMNEELRAIRSFIRNFRVLLVAFAAAILFFIWKTTADERAIISEMQMRTGPLEKFPRAKDGTVTSLNTQIGEIRTAIQSIQSDYTAVRQSVEAIKTPSLPDALTRIAAEAEAAKTDADLDARPDATTDVSHELASRHLVAFAGYRLTGGTVHAYYVGSVSPKPTPHPVLHFIDCLAIKDGGPIGKKPTETVPVHTSVGQCFVTTSIQDDDPVGG